MRESRTYGSVGALGGKPPRATRPAEQGAWRKRPGGSDAGGAEGIAVGDRHEHYYYAGWRGFRATDIVSPLPTLRKSRARRDESGRRQ